MTPTPFNVGVAVIGPPTAPRALVRHADLLLAYADGEMLERDETREAYLSHFAFGQQMQAHYAANRNSVAGFTGACWCRWLVLDIDRTDLADALADACRLAASITDRYGTDPAVWFSGNKGFHVAVELIHNPPPSVGFHRVARTFAETLAARAGVPIDTSVYDLAHIIRLPGTQHPKTGLFKRRIDADDLCRATVESVRRHAAHPAGDGLPQWNGDVDQLAADWREAETAANRDAEARAATRRDFRPDARAPKYLIDFLRFGVNQGERHTTLFRCAAWLTEQGAPPSLCHALLAEAGCDVGLAPREVDRQIRCGIEHATRQRAAADPRPDPTTDPDAFEAWTIRHEDDPLPADTMEFPFGANTSEGGLT